MIGVDGIESKIDETAYLLDLLPIFRRSFRHLDANFLELSTPFTFRNRIHPQI